MTWFSGSALASTSFVKKPGLTPRARISWASGLCVLLAISSPVGADPATPDPHHERQFIPIGGGLFLDRDSRGRAHAHIEKATGVIEIEVYSSTPINRGERYILDIGPITDNGDLIVDGGSLGHLYWQTVTMDCIHRTYKVLDTKWGDYIWRAAGTFPALAPLFAYVCKPPHSTHPG